MAAFHPAAETPSIKLGTARAVHVERLCNSFLPAGRRHDDLERRPRRQLRLNCLVHQWLIGISHQLAPLIARHPHGKIVGIKGRPAHHRQDFSRPRVHRDNGAVLPFQRFLGRDLQINVDSQL